MSASDGRFLEPQNTSINRYVTKKILHCTTR